MKLIKNTLLALGIIGGLVMTAPLATVSAQYDPLNTACSGSASGTAICQNRTTDRVSPFVKSLVAVLLYVMAAVSVLVIIIAGIFYLTAGGDNAAIAKAKNTLLYAVIGLVVSLLAYAIVAFITKSFTL